MLHKIHMCTKFNECWHTKKKPSIIYNLIPFKIYGLAQLHKNKIPLRSIDVWVQPPLENFPKYFIKYDT